MFDQLLSFITKTTSIQPKYTPEHCLVVTHAIGGCEKCKKACPHEVIEIKRQVEIDELDCSGCGLCVQACPSQALEPSISYQTGTPLKCSQVKGNSQSIQCLGRLQPTDILRLAGKQRKVNLVRNDCCNCPIGNENVISAVENILAEARTLAEIVGLNITANILIKEKFAATDLPDKLSRREFLRGNLHNFQAGAADVLAPLEHLVPEDESTLPLEHNKKFKVLKLAELAPEAEVAWPLPRVKEGCILCPVCTNVCPTSAFSREFENENSTEGNVSVLKLLPEQCNGCNACTVSCPVNVIYLDEIVTWEEISGGLQEVYHHKENGRVGARE